ncbi:MAG TPA: DUF192 domain-containing protein [Planktothrix sp.]|jgi:hypothetical protein
MTQRIAGAVAILMTAFLMPIASEGAGEADAKMPTAKIGTNVIKLEVAASETEIEKGLMYRTSMPEDQGMVFLFRPARKVNFWMYHTLIPLDMLFVQNGKIKKIFHEVPVCKSENPSDCPLYPGGEGLEVSEVIELNAGYAKRHDLNEGEKLEIDL